VTWSSNKQHWPVHNVVALQTSGSALFTRLTGFDPNFIIDLAHLRALGRYMIAQTAYNASANSPFSTCPRNHDTIVCAKPRRRADQLQACFLSHSIQRGPERLVTRYTASHNQRLHIWVAFFCPGCCSATPLCQMCDGNSLE